MIERHWKGTTDDENSDKYIRHLMDETFPQLATIPGFKKASILKRITNKGIEFLIITTWESVDAVKKFAGEEFATAVVPKRVQDIMIEYDKKVRHYEVIVETD
jgi:heme-degrading monooxygenase HmoA